MRAGVAAGAVFAALGLVGVAPGSLVSAQTASCDCPGANGVTSSGVAGPNGCLVENTEFEHVVEEDVTQVVRVVGPGLDVVAPGGDPFAVVPPGTVFDDPPTVESVLTDTTFGQTESVDVCQSDDAVVIGDIGSDGDGDFLVTNGTVVITTTETTTETRHITETTTYQVLSIGAPPGVPVTAAPTAPVPPTPSPAAPVAAQPRTTG